MNTNELIDKAPLDVAKGAHEATARRLDTCKADLETKRQALAAAKVALDEAIGGSATGKGAKLTPAAAQRAFRDARDDAELAETLHDATFQALTDAAAATRSAQASIHEPVMLHGARERIEAAKDFQTALEGMRASFKRSEAANASVRIAIANGCKLPFDGNLLPPTVHLHLYTQPNEYQRSLRTPQEEAALWGIEP